MQSPTKTAVKARRRLPIALCSGLLAVLSAAPASVAWAEVIWIGRPTARDYIAYNLHKAGESYVELRENMALFEAKAADARKAYFSASPSQRAAAGDTFGQVLFEKDLLIAWPQVIGGADQGRLVANLMALANNGRPPDGGVPPSALKAFAGWVSSMRIRVGGATGVLSNPANAAAVLQDSASLQEYEAYRRLRDQAEFDEWEAQHTGAPRKLLETHLIRPTTYFGENAMMKGFDYRIAQLKEQILQCEYAGRKADGSIFHFWKGQPPENIAMLIAMNRSGFSGLVDHAVDACPAQSNSVEVIHSSRAMVSITPEMDKEARIQARYPPPDPEEVRAALARNAAAKKKMEDRNAIDEAKREKGRVCVQEMQVAMAAARQSKDIPSMSAARAGYQECVREVRQRP